MPAGRPPRVAGSFALHLAPLIAAPVLSPTRPTAPRRGRWAALGAGLLLMTACQAQPGAASATEAALLARIRTEVGEARCSADSQCRTLAIGAKACGGPESWLAWSTATVPGAAGRAERLQAWSTELAAQQRQRQQASGMVSNCQYNADPGAVCQAQRCVLQTPSLAR